MPAHCATCEHPERETIDRALVLGDVPIRELARRYGMHRTSLSRHKAAHIAPALAQVVAERSAAGPRSAMDRIEELIDRVGRVLDKAEQDGQAKLFLDAARELRGLVDLLARITGELRDTPQVAVVLAQTGEWQEFRDRLLLTLDDHPAVRDRVLGELVAAVESDAEDPRGPASAVGVGSLARAGGRP